MRQFFSQTFIAFQVSWILLKIYDLVQQPWWIITLPTSLFIFFVLLAGVVVGVAKSIVAKQQQAAEAVAKPAPYRRGVSPEDNYGSQDR